MCLINQFRPREPCSSQSHCIVKWKVRRRETETDISHRQKKLEIRVVVVQFLVKLAKILREKQHIHLGSLMLQGAKDKTHYLSPLSPAAAMVNRLVYL